MVYQASISHSLSLYYCPNIFGLGRSISTSHKQYLFGFVYSLWYSMEGVNLNGACDTKLACNDDSWKEFEVDISHELIRMDKKGMWLVVLVLIPRGQF